MELQIGTKILVHKIPGRHPMFFTDGALPFESEIIGLPKLNINIPSQEFRVLISDRKELWKDKSCAGWAFNKAADDWRLFDAKKINQPVLYITSKQGIECFEVIKNQPPIVEDTRSKIGQFFGSDCQIIGYAFSGYHLLKVPNNNWSGPDLTLDTIQRMDRISGPGVSDLDNGIKYRIVPEDEFDIRNSYFEFIRNISGPTLKQYT